MVVCHCHAVNDGTIRKCLEAGARSGSEVREACGAGGTCGGCRPHIDRLIELKHGARAAIEARASRS